MNLKQITLIGLIASNISLYTMKQNELVPVAKPVTQGIRIGHLFTPIHFNNETKPFNEFFLHDKQFRKTKVALFSFNQFTIQGEIQKISSTQLVDLSMGNGFYCSNVNKQYGIIGIWNGNKLSELLKDNKQMYANLKTFDRTFASILLAHYIKYSKDHKKASKKQIKVL